MPGLTERDILCDGVILAIAGAALEGVERRAPDVILAILGEVADRPDRQIDGAVDLAEAGAAIARAGLVDNAEQAQRRRRHAVLAIAVAQGNLHAIVVELARKLQPFVPEGAGKDLRGRQTKWAGGRRQGTASPAGSPMGPASAAIALLNDRAAQPSATASNARARL